MTTTSKILALTTAFLAGCVFALMIPTSHAASATPTHQYSACFAARLDWVSAETLARGEVAKGTPVPKGWTPVGGAGGVHDRKFAIYCK